MTPAIDVRTRLRGGIAIAVLAAAVALPAQAAAQNDCSKSHSDPTAAQYCPQSNVLNEDTTGNSPSTSETAPVATPVSSPETAPVATSSSGGSLPFTGLDVGILVLAAALLTGTGLLLRRLTAPGAPKS
jgi:hypothetical protein